jgi:hypothetical protein
MLIVKHENRPDFSTLILHLSGSEMHSWMSFWMHGSENNYSQLAENSPLKFRELEKELKEAKSIIQEKNCEITKLKMKLDDLVKFPVENKSLPLKSLADETKELMEIGYKHLRGLGVPVDKQKAIELISQAANENTHYFITQ